MKKEIWKFIPGASHYEASTLGRIRSINRTIRVKRRDNNKVHMQSNLGRLLKFHKGLHGYFMVGIYGDTKRHITNTVHSLVAATFLGPRPLGSDVAHLNGKKSDNRVENLKYCTRKENESHKRAHGTLPIGEKHPMAKLKNKDVLNIRKLVKQGIPKKEIAEKYGVLRWQIYNINNRKNWAHLA